MTEFERIRFLIKETHLCSVINREGSFYIISSIYTLDCGFETMIFPSDENGKIFDYADLYCKHYEHYNEMVKNHDYLVSQWEPGK